MRLPGSHLSLSARVLIGMGAGILVGILFGHWVKPLGLVGDAFVLLLQMPVLPYVAVSLVASLGRLDYKTAGELAIRGGVLLLILWALALAMVALYPLSFPRWESASFFSTSLVSPPEKLELLHLYIPANPFNSLANNMVPGVVLFSVVLGVTLIGMPKKDLLLDSLDVAVEALSKVSRKIAELAPLGVFAISAHAAGTLTVADLGRLQVYVWTYLAVSLVMALWIMPGLVAALTPLSYRDVVGPVRDVLVTAFATGNLFIVLPMLADRSNKVLQRCIDEEDYEEGHRLVEVIVPTSFNFPNVGKLLTLTFVLYAGWYSGAEVPVSKIPGFLLMGLFSFFGSIPMAMPFLLDQLTIPADMFQIYLVLNNMVNVRFGTLMSAMHIIVLAVLGAYVILGKPIRWFKLARWAVISVVMTLGVLFGVRVALETFVPHEYEMDQVFEALGTTQEYASVRILEGEPEPLPKPAGVRRVEAIRDRGFLRVGYFADSLPYVYVNTAGELVGYDAEMARILAEELGVDLEFVKLPARERAAVALEEERVDIVMSAMAKTTNRMIDMEFSVGYQDLTLAFIVPDHRKEEFSSIAELSRRENLRLGMTAERQIQDAVVDMLPNAELVPTTSPRPYLQGKEPELDGVVHSAEAGSAWCLIYPAYSVAVPRDRLYKAPLAYPVAGQDAEFAFFVSQWIALKRMDGTLERLYDHWILGLSAGESEPREAIIDNWWGFWGDETPADPEPASDEGG